MQETILKTIENMPNYDFYFKDNTLVIYELMGDVVHFNVNENDRRAIYNLLVKY